MGFRVGHRRVQAAEFRETHIFGHVLKSPSLKEMFVDILLVKTNNL